MTVKAIDPNGLVRDIRSDSSGNLSTTLGTRLAGEDVVVDRLLVEFGNVATRVTGSTSGQTIKTGSGYLHSIVVATPKAGKTITVTANGGTLCVITCDSTNLQPFAVHFGIRFSTSLQVTLNDSTLDVVVCWRG